MGARKKTVTKMDSSYIDKYDAHIGRQQRKKKRLTRRLILFAVVVMIALGSMATYHIKQREVYADKAEEYELLQEEYASLEQAEAYYKEEINLLNDDEYILDIARTDYFFSKEGELIFKVPNKDPSY